MPVVFQKRRRDFEAYSPNSRKVEWVRVSRKGQVWQDPESGETIELFRVKIFAEALDRTTEAIKEWHKTGKLPPPLFVPEGEQCKHWYSATQIVNCHRLMTGKYRGAKYIHNRVLFEQFIADVQAVWYAQQVIVREDGSMQ
jgi:hypothetical protein